MNLYQRLIKFNMENIEKRKINYRGEQIISKGPAAALKKHIMYDSINISIKYEQ